MKKVLERIFNKNKESPTPISFEGYDYTDVMIMDIMKVAQMRLVVFFKEEK